MRLRGSIHAGFVLLLAATALLYTAACDSPKESPPADKVDIDARTRALEKTVESVRTSADQRIKEAATKSDARDAGERASPEQQE